ncbi:Ctr copper transporter [Zopfochytrium polystomum]|nr:Ctr copper transporter [Zopfochytrium polystomum]
MTPYFHTRIQVPILLEPLVPRSPTAFAAAWLFCVVLAALPAAVAALRRRWVADRVRYVAAAPPLVFSGRHGAGGGGGGGGGAGAFSALPQGDLGAGAGEGDAGGLLVRLRRRGRLRRWPTAAAAASSLGRLWAAVDFSFQLHHAVKTMLRGVEVALSYLVMLVVMQFNAALFGAVVLGAVVGAWIFEWDEAEERDALCCT